MSLNFSTSWKLLFILLNDLSTFSEITSCKNNANIANKCRGLSNNGSNKVICNIAEKDSKESRKNKFKIKEDINNEKYKNKESINNRKK